MVSCRLILFHLLLIHHSCIQSRTDVLLWIRITQHYSKEVQTQTHTHLYMYIPYLVGGILLCLSDGAGFGMPLYFGGYENPEVV